MICHFCHFPSNTVACATFGASPRAGEMAGPVSPSALTGLCPMLSRTGPLARPAFSAPPVEGLQTGPAAPPDAPLWGRPACLFRPARRPCGALRPGPVFSWSQRPGRAVGAFEPALFKRRDACRSLPAFPRRWLAQTRLHFLRFVLRCQLG